MKKTITILTPTYNEVDNIDELRSRICKVIEEIPDYNFEHLFIDNSSSDGTVDKLKKIAKKNKKVKVIVNARNFGAPSSVLHALKQVKTDACIHIASDLQDPPEIIKELVKEHENGAEVVHTVRTKRLGESKVKMFLTLAAYKIINFFFRYTPAC